MDNIDKLDRKALQKLAKEHGIKANLKVVLNQMNAIQNGDTLMCTVGRARYSNSANDFTSRSHLSSSDQQRGGVNQRGGKWAFAFYCVRCGGQSR